MYVVSMCKEPRLFVYGAVNANSANKKLRRSCELNASVRVSREFTDDDANRISINFFYIARFYLIFLCLILGGCACACAYVA